ncbi:MAG TPA: GspE/PulE family protein [Dissulfurispiraceae bacterium]
MDDRANRFALQILFSAGLLSQEQIDNILSKEEFYRNRLRKLKASGAKRGKTVHADISLIDIIDSLKFKVPWNEDRELTEELIMEYIAKYFEHPFLKIDPLKLDSDLITSTVPRLYAIRHQLIPLKLEGNVLTVATSNPFQLEGIEGIRHSKGYEIKIVVSTKSDIQKIITEFYGFKSSVAAAHEEMSSQTDLNNLEQYVKLKPVSELSSTDQHIINAVEYLLHYAYSQRASDIHIEPKRDHSLIRFRIDGILHNIHKMPKSIHPAFVSRIKTLARMDIAEKRRPQDGRIKTEKDGKETELRVSTVLVAFGEKVVIRIFDPSILIQKIDQLGFLERELGLFKAFIEASHGLILVTGPTGSGKTTTLYSALKSLSTPDVNITTIEDPVEMVYDEFNQTAVQPHIGISFAGTLRTLLRQDPDIIMVGEIRDLETAENAVQAALTGHLVLSTLHTNDAPSSITRLLDLGIAPFLINSTLIGVIAQRLVRKVCGHCIERYPVMEDECRMLGIDYAEVKDTIVARGGGCPQCRGTGYLGRIGVFEVMEITEKVREAVEKNAPPDLMRSIARSEGIATLRGNAVKIFLKGITTFDEIMRVIGV